MQTEHHIYVALSLPFTPNLLSDAAVYTNTMQEALEMEFNRRIVQYTFS